MALFLLTGGSQLFKIVAIFLADSLSSLVVDCLVVTTCLGMMALNFFSPKPVIQNVISADTSHS